MVCGDTVRKPCDVCVWGGVECINVRLFRFVFDRVNQTFLQAVVDI